MSRSDHRYTARIAPASSTAVDAIHDGATTLMERGERFTESIAAGGLIWPTKACAVLIDHDERFPVGFVSEVAERDGWHEATWVLDTEKPLADVARDLLRFGTPVSIGAKSLLRDESLADLGLATPVIRHTTAVARRGLDPQPRSRARLQGREGDQDHGARDGARPNARARAREGQAEAPACDDAHGARR